MVVGKHSEETKAKISQSLKDKEWSPEALANRVNFSQSWTGKKRPPQSDEVIQHHVEAMVEWHTNNEHPMTGKHHSEETRLKISVGNKGKKLSAEHNEKMHRATKMTAEREQEILQAYQSGETIADIEVRLNTGRSSIYRVLTRNNISRERDRKIWLGKSHSEETKQKMAEARKEYWSKGDTNQ